MSKARMWRVAPKGRTAIAAPAPSWTRDAACKGEDVNLFFAAEGEYRADRQIREDKAKSICASCPVRLECLDHAVTLPERSGTWGGLNEEERDLERRRRMRKAKEAAA